MFSILTIAMLFFKKTRGMRINMKAFMLLLVIIDVLFGQTGSF